MPIAGADFKSVPGMCNFCQILLMKEKKWKKQIK